MKISSISKNIQIFLVYTLCISIFMLSSIIGNLGLELNFINCLSEIVKAIGLFFTYIILLSWLNNIIYLVFFKIKGYTFNTISIFPLIWIKNNKMRVKLSGFICMLIELHTQISYIQIQSRKDCEKYIEEYRKCLKIIKMTHIVLYFVYVIVILQSVSLLICLLAAHSAVIAVYNLETSEVLQGGLWKFGLDEGKEKYLFLRANLENFDKDIIYTYIQEYGNLEDKKINDKLIICNILVDTIYDKKEYCCESMKETLENRFLLSRKVLLLWINLQHYLYIPINRKAY